MAMDKTGLAHGGDGGTQVVTAQKDIDVARVTHRGFIDA